MRNPARIILFVFCLSLLLPLTAFADSLSVTAVVPANETDFSAVLSSDTTDTVVGQDRTITYTLTYGSLLDTETPITLVATWSRGTTVGSGTNVDVVSYVPGSATDAYGNTPAVVDGVNRKITWGIPSFGASTTGQKVSFSLKTSATLTSADTISFTVAGHLLGPGFVTSDSSLTKDFLSSSTPSPTNTPTPGPTSTPTPIESGPTPTPPPPHPTVDQTPVALKVVTIQTISSTDATIAIALNQVGTASLLYGNAISQLTTSASDNTSSINHLITLSDLKPGTTYFFKVNYGTTSSELFTFVTALPGEVPAPLLSSLVITSGNTILSNPLQKEITQKDQQIMLPTSSVYEFRITIPNASELKSVQAVLRNAHLLSFSSFPPHGEESSDIVDLIQISPGIFSGKLLTQTVSGEYLLILRLSDKKGNIVEQKVAAFRITHPFQVHDSSDKPLEAARVQLFYWDSTKKQFTFLNPQSIGVINPSFTDNKGEITVVLPNGRYKAEVSDLRYASKNVEFSIGNAPTDGYPDVTMQKQAFNLINTLSYYGTTLHDLLFVQTTTYLASLSLSRRMLDLIAVLIMSTFAVLLVFSFIIRIQISFFMLPEYFSYLFKKLLHRSKTDHTVRGIITDTDSEKGLLNVTIYARDEYTDKIVSHTTTNKNGEFNLNLNPDSNYTLTLVKALYRPFQLSNISPKIYTTPILVSLSSHAHRIDLRHIVMDIFIHLLSISFEILLVLSLLFTITIGMSLGWWEVFPYLLIAVINLFTWLLHKHYKHIKIA